MRQIPKRTAIRVAAAAVAAACLLAAPVSAAMGGSGAGQAIQHTDHDGPDRQFHLANGEKLPVQVPTSEDRAAFLELLNLNSSYEITVMDGEMSVLNIAVGETVYLHTSQADYEINNQVSNWMRWSVYHTKFETVVDKELADMTPDDLYQTPVPSSSGGAYNNLCLEWSITGESEGVDYLIYRCGPTAEMHLKIVVSGTSGQLASNSTSTTSSGGSSSSASGGSSSGSTSGANSGGGSASGAALTTTSDGAVYTVQAGDTLGTIALNYYGSYALWTELQRVNQDYLNQTANGTIYAGFRLLLPDTLAGVSRTSPPTAGSGETLYTVKAGETLGIIAQNHYGNANRYRDIYERNADRLPDVHTLYEGQIIVLP